MTPTDYGNCPRCGGPNPDPHMHERTGRPCYGPNAPWPSYLDEHGNPRHGRDANGDPLHAPAQPSAPASKKRK